MTRSTEFVTVPREPEPVQPIPHGRDRHPQPVLVAQCLRHSLLRQIALFLQPLANPRLIRANLAPARIALPLRRKRTGLALEAHHVVDELDRNPEMRRRSAVRIAFLDKPDNALAQLYWMWLAHR